MVLDTNTCRLAGGCNVMVDHFETNETLALMEREQINFVSWCLPW